MCSPVEGFDPLPLPDEEVGDGTDVLSVGPATDVVTAGKLVLVVELVVDVVFVCTDSGNVLADVSKLVSWICRSTYSFWLRNSICVVIVSTVSVSCK